MSGPAFHRDTCFGIPDSQRTFPVRLRLEIPATSCLVMKFGPLLANLHLESGLGFDYRD